MNNLNRYAYGNLIESMDWCDATRSHESIPSVRLSYAYRHRRFVRRVYGSLVLIAVVGIVAGFVQ